MHNMKCSPCPNATSRLNPRRKDYTHSLTSITDMNLIDQITTIYEEKFGRTPAHIARAPERVHLLGEHVDYNEGSDFCSALEGGFINAIWLILSNLKIRQI